MKNSLKILEEAINNKEPIIVNYGKAFINGGDIKEPAYWDEKQNTYTSQTGVWDLKLLYEIARGEVEETTIEKYDL